MKLIKDKKKLNKFAEEQEHSLTYELIVDSRQNYRIARNVAILEAVTICFLVFAFIIK